MNLSIEDRTNLNKTTNIYTFRRTLEASRCRRRREREKLTPSKVRCWSYAESPTEVTSIEVDRRGARLILPWNTVPGEHVRISLANDMGEYQTTRARVVWTQRLPNSMKVIAGLCFDEEIQLAA